MSARHERHEYHTSDSSASTTRVLHECDTSETILILIRAQVKTFSHPYIYYMAREGYKESNNFILRTIFWKYLILMLKCV